MLCIYSPCNEWAAALEALGARAQVLSEPEGQGTQRVMAWLLSCFSGGSFPGESWIIKI